MLRTDVAAHQEREGKLQTRRWRTPRARAYNGAGMEQQKENRDTSIAGKPVPWEALVISSRMTQIIKRKWSTTCMTIYLCITPKGKTDCNYLGISCESRILEGSLILKHFVGEVVKRRLRKRRKKKVQVQRFQFSFFLPVFISIF